MIPVALCLLRPLMSLRDPTRDMHSSDRESTTGGMTGEMIAGTTAAIIAAAVMIAETETATATETETETETAGTSKHQQPQ